ncbi:MAG: PEP-CTERM sorting domain-containing protein [Rubrivivax sp.]|nr:MAG: PEP-CTERM sorting domain-containing protein [Rubrivivax sp.]
MKPTRTALMALAAAWGLALSMSAQAQSFTNLDFESANFDRNGGMFVDWSLAAPGWQHSAGNDTSIVYWRQTHIGGSQIYLLESASESFGSKPWIEGEYGMYFRSGVERGSDWNSPWINAYLAQTGLVAAGTQSIRLIARGPSGFEVSLDGTPIALTAVGQDEFVGDVSAFAGRVAELRITDTVSRANNQFDGVHVDNIRFSTSPVPEAGTLSLMLLGMGGLLGARRWRRPAR